MTVQFRQTLRNARVVGEFAVKGFERMLRERLGGQSGSAKTAEPSVYPPVAPMEEPIADYGLLTASQIIGRSKEWSSDVRIKAREYELANRNRKSVLEALR